MSFSDIFGIDDLGSAIADRRPGDSTSFRKALRLHLGILRGGGRLGLVTGLVNRDIRVASDWNAYVAGAEASDILLATVFPHILSLCVVMGSVDRESLERIHAALTATLDAGDTDNLWNVMPVTDYETGENVTLRFVDWKPHLVRLEGGEQVPIGDADEREIVPVTFPVPTGRLLITDVLDIEEFRNAADSKRGGFMTLNTAAGRDRYTKVTARDVGYGMVPTGNTDVTVARQDGGERILVVDGIRDIPGWTRLGTVSCTTWCVTIIDPATVVEIMTGDEYEDAEEEAEIRRDCEAELARHLRMVDSDPAIQSSRHDDQERRASRNILRIDVPAGSWRMVAGEVFADKVDRAAYGIPDGIHPWLVLMPA